ncbi:MAG: M13 family metallopeptidase [Alphaproteobacteria bacterium]|nr:M13 family metallopeptidase [Alphaproteobacteria bacterium]MCB9699234.1 M13 family metallopeptidase [Alphaproteobacteria bacterium]
MLHHTARTVVVATLLASCSGGAKAPPEAATPPAPPAEGTFQREMWDAMDRQADPCDDFYQYACGGWMASNQLPADKSAYGRGFSTIQERNQVLLREVLEKVAAAPADPDQEKLAAFWKACNDTAAIDAAGMQPIAEDWKVVDGLKSKKDLMALLGKLSAGGDDVLFDVWIDADQKNPGLAIVHLVQGGTGLPERSYYLDEATQEVRDAYVAYIEKMLVLAGVEEASAKKQAADILAFETKLAEVSWEAERLGDATATYNKLDRDGLQKATPGLDWAAYLKNAGQPDLTQINVMTPSFFEALPGIVDGTDLAVLRSYVKFRVLSHAASDLASSFEDAQFDFYGRTLFGQQEQEERWKRCVDKADGAIGDLLSQAYIDAAFAGDSKDIALDMIQRIEGSFEAGLPSLSWMDDDTRARAIEKVRAITNKIGYPNEFRKYDFELSATDHFGNQRKAAAATHDWWWSKAEKPVDPDTWFMTAPTVNAYYNPSQNEIVFPAGILQPPFFSSSFPRAVNFGAMGLVMGHEISHGFDDEGRKFDGSGRMTDWWAPDAVTRFEEATSCVEKQYDAYEVLPGVNLNGKLTLGENIADLGGSRTAFRAYRKWVEENGAEPEVLPGLSNEQTFWVSFAQSWCQIASEEHMKVRAKTDPHSAPRFRVNGPLSNLPEFHETFSCEEGRPLHPASTCEVW